MGINGALLVGVDLANTVIGKGILTSYLEFVFAQPDSKTVNRKMYFLDNPNISESRKANYAKYIPISRNSAIPFYLGSESRVFKIDMKLSWQYLASNPYILEEILKNLGSANTGNFAKNSAALPTQLNNKQNFKMDETVAKAQDLVYRYLNLIRTSVINNAQSPTYGPPLIRLNFGSLYSDIPCICTDYNISKMNLVDDKANALDIDLISKLPYTVQVTMTLEEVRLGNYLRTAFDPENNESRDNIVGWEQIINDKGYGSLDPITPILRQ